MLLCDLDGEKMSDKMDLVDLMPGESCLGGAIAPVQAWLWKADCTIVLTGGV